jgi:RNA polymerase sigma-B factor
MTAVMTTTTRAQRASDDHRLFAHYQDTRDPGLREQLVERFMPLARHLANRYSYRGESDDLVQVASLGLLKAIERFDADRGLAFSTFAMPTILGELKRYFRDYGWTVRPPRDLQDRALQVNRVSERLSARLGRAPTPNEVAEETGTSVEQVLEALETASAYRPDRLDRPVDDDDARAPQLGGGEDPGFAHAEDAATLTTLARTLSARDREVLRLRFQEDLTQSEIGARLGYSQMHVSRILRHAIATMQARASE